MGYQAESGPWRSVYLQGAYELRNGVPDVATTDAASPDTIKAMPPAMLFDYLSVRLDGPKAAGKVITITITINIDFDDLKQVYGLAVENGVLNYRPQPVQDADVTVTTTKATLDDVQLGENTLDQARSDRSISFKAMRRSSTSSSAC